MTPSTTVTQLLRAALVRLEYDYDEADDDPLELVLSSDQRACLFADDQVLDVVEDGAELMIVRRSSRKRQKVEHVAAPSANLSTGAVAAAAGDLEVCWALQSGEHGVVRVDASTTQLCTLAQMIEAQLSASGEQPDPARTMSVELYAEAGYPLGSSDTKKLATLAQLGWPSSGQAKCYAVRCSRNNDVEEPTATADPNMGSVQLFARGDRTFIIMGELTDSVLTLKLKIKAKMGWPVSRQLLSYQAHRLRDDTASLRDCGVGSNGTIHVKLALPPLSKTLTGWESNFAAAMYEPLVPQSTAGLASFYSTLYVLERAVDEEDKLMGALRRMTQFPPLISTINELLQRRQLTPAQRVALVEGFYLLFRSIAPPKLPGAAADSEGHADDEVFEASPKCWAWILRNMVDADASTDSKERWKKVDLCCALSDSQFSDVALEDVLRPPAWWRTESVKGRACSRVALLESIEADASPGSSSGAAAPTGDARPLLVGDLEPATDIVRLVAGHPGREEVTIWSPPERAADEVSSIFAVRPAPLDRPTGSSWASLSQTIRTILDGVLVVRSPLELKSNRRDIALARHPISGAHLCVYVSKTKSTVPQAEIYDPLSGETSKHEYEEWAAALSDRSGGGDDGTPRVTRPPREAIVVLLDVSSSMRQDGFVVPVPDFDPVDRSRAQGDLQTGDTARFLPDANVANADGQELDLPAGTIGTVIEAPPRHGQRVAVIRFRTRKYGNTRIDAASLEVLTPRGAAAVTPLPRIDTVKQLFVAYANRSIAYDFPHVIGLTTFGTKVECVRKLTEAFESFKRAVDSTEPSGTTRLYDALETARRELDAFVNGLATAPPEGVIKRIIVLTDGEDTNSTIQAHEVSAALQRDGVVVDSVVIGSELKDISTELRAISIATGGCAFHPKSINGALRLFETETILSARCRAVDDAHRPKPPVNSEEDLQVFAGGRLGAVEGWDEPPEARLPEAVKEAVSLPTTALNHALVDARGKTSSTSRLKRILRELSSYVRMPHPAFEVFPSDSRLDLWQLLLKGPEGTPYADGAFHLWMQFPAEYPAEAPEVRFLTPIHHCNINSHGRVCHSVFDRNWTTDTKVRDVLNCVYGLLLEPEPDDPLDSVLALQFLSTRAAYDAAARELTRSKASVAYDTLRARLLQEETEDGAAAGGRRTSGTHPKHLCCPITTELFLVPVTTKHGQTFDKAALLDAVRRQPLCPLTRQPLAAEEVEELAVNVFIKDAVQQYKQATPWWDEE